MKREQIEFLSAILLASHDAERLARFYRDTLGIPLEEEQHGDTLPHWGCTMGDIHFAIHPFEDFPDHPRHGVGAVKLAFTVFDLAGMHRRLVQAAANVLYPPRDDAAVARCFEATKINPLADDADYRTPWEKGEDDRLEAWELDQIRRSAANMRALGIL